MRRRPTVCRVCRVCRGRVRCFSVLVLTIIASLLLLTAVFPAAAAPLPLTHGWTQVAKDGFTDPGNTHIPFVAEFHGYLYVSTLASGQGALYSGSDKIGGDIWRTADGVDWEQIGTPGLGNPQNFMFDFVVFKDHLYALSYNAGDHGMEVWMTSDGVEFTKLEAGGFGDPNSDHAVPFVFADRLILMVANSETGVQVWVSDDGQSFRQVVAGGLGIPGTTGALRYIDPTDPQPVFKDKFYVGISNPSTGGELWRTTDGIQWERVAEGGLGRATSVSLAPDVIYKDQLYVIGHASGTLEDLQGFELFRSSDGITWEKVVEDGFSAGVERNIYADLVEFDGRLYLTSSNMDPRILVPDNPTERHAPQGFQLRVSDDGSNWTQVGKDGFGISTSFFAGTVVMDGTAYLEAYDYHAGSSLWKSSDGESWQIIFQEPEPNFFQGGGGFMAFKGHFLWISSDLKNGLEIWRSDDVMVASSDDTPDGQTTTSNGEETATGVTEDPGEGLTNGSQTNPQNSTGQQDGRSSDESAPEDSHGISGGWIALIAVLAAVAVAGLVATAYLFGRTRHSSPHPSSHPASQPATPAGTPPAQAPPAQAEETQTGSQYCSGCGAPLNPSAQFCAECGRRIGD